MKFTAMVLVLSVFAVGFGIGGMIAIQLPTQDPILDTHTVLHRGLTTQSVQATTIDAEPELRATTSTPDFGLASEQGSPWDRIPEQNIEMRSDGVFIKLANPQWAVFADTNSMDPVLDQGHHAIQQVPASEEDIHVGDIISYKSPMGFSVIHRVQRIGRDDSGWYAIVKGDNNPAPDPLKVRFDQITRVVVALIY